ncbi:MAG: non-ribosomal peptide synthetase, partial [Planctomycetaceae bacterium]|nr:non-ribosomal peptide synthetase [Planctomycetaceae bacterium]
NAYNMPFTWRLRGDLNREALRRALEELVRRHEPLRTTFELVDEEPVQRIGEPVAFELGCDDLSSFDHDQQSDAIEQRLRVEANQPFDLRSDLMVRSSLLRLGDQDHLFLLTVHHIANDGWSISILWRELEMYYRAFCMGVKPELPALTIQYADYAVWQREQGADESGDSDLSYWRVQLQDLETLELPSDRPRLPQLTYRGSRLDFEFDDELVKRLESQCQQENVTLQMFLLAAFQTLLSRYSGQHDIAVGTPIAGRQSKELESLVGFFVNTLVLRSDLSGNPSFRELLQRVRQVSLEAYDHQSLPFERLVEELAPERHRDRNPLIQVIFQLLDYEDQNLALHELEVEKRLGCSDLTRFDLEFHLWRQPSGLRGTIVYSSDLFDSDRIERLVGHWTVLLESILADPDQAISRLALLPDWERQQL